jgi:hypothetical protein
VLYAAVSTCTVSGDSGCQTFIPIVLYGDRAKVGLRLESLTQTTKHIQDAVLTGKSFILSAFKNDKTKWYDKKEECSNYMRRLYQRSNGGKGACDEYPFNSTEQGGEKEYDLGLVSLRLVPVEESSSQGALMDTRSKVEAAGVVLGDNNKKWYGVVALPFLPVSFWRTREGKILY